MNNHKPRHYAALALDSLARYKDKTCFTIKRRPVQGGEEVWESWTYGQFLAEIKKIALFLDEQQIPGGAPVVFLGENTPEWLAVYHAAILSGRVAVPVDPNATADLLSAVISRTGARIIFVSPPYAGLLQQTQLILQRDNHALAVMVDLPSAHSLQESDSTGSDSQVLSYADCLSSALKKADAGKISPQSDLDKVRDNEEEAAILFTSGTTGSPKGVVLSLGNLSGPYLYGIPAMKITRDDVFLAVLPLYHAFGFSVLTAGFLNGVKNVLVAEMKGPLIVQALVENGVTVFPSVPQMLEMIYFGLRRKIREKGLAINTLVSIFFTLSRGLSFLPLSTANGIRRVLFKSIHANFGGKLALLVSGGASIGKDAFLGFGYLGFEIVEGYGLTETFGPLCAYPRGQAKLASVGQALGDNQVRLLKSDENMEHGEVLVRGSAVFKGYYGDTQATAEAVDGDGWFHTGDLGYIDRDNYLFLTGRAKDIIVLPSGKNVYPEEIEALYSKSEVIEELAVFGQKNAAGQEMVCALIFPSPALLRKQHMANVKEQIRKTLDTLATGLPSYKRIFTYKLTTSELPRTSTRKFRKKEIKEIFNTQDDRKDSTRADTHSLTATQLNLSRSPEYRALLPLLADLIQGSESDIQINSHLEYDLGLDSLKKVDLLERIETTFPAARLQEGELLACSTVMQLCQMLTEAESVDQSGEGSDSSEAGEDPAPQEPNASLLFAFMSRLLSLCTVCLYRPRVEGLENIEEAGSLLQQGKVIFASNHESLLDVGWIVAALPPLLRKSTFVLGKRDLLNIPLLGTLFTRLNFIPIERGVDVSSAMRVSKQLLNNGLNLLVFPEGTRSLTGEMGPFKTGVTRLAQETGCVIVPCRVCGSYDLWPPGKTIPGFTLFGLGKSRPSVHFAAPLTYSDLTRESPDVSIPAYQDAANTLRENIARLG